MRTIALHIGAFFLISLAAIPDSFGQYSGIEKHRRHERNIDQRLLHLEALDFHVLAHRDWNRIGQSHAKNVVVHWPDGRRTKGLNHHVEDLQRMFVYVPDLRVRSHPVKFSSRDWTCVIAEMEGTFTRPMRTSDGREIPPTGKHFKITMCTVGHWNKRGLIDEEYLFWDNQSYMRQLAVTK